MDGKRDIAPWIERVARVGYLAKALLYGTDADRAVETG